MSDVLLFRMYDDGFIARFAPATVTVGGVSVYQVTVPGVTNPVPLGMGMPAEWFTTFGMPYISVTRGLVIPAPKRALPAWRGQEPGVGTAITIQNAAPQAVNIPYAVELIAATMQDANALSAYLLLTALPVMGFGTVVVVGGRNYAYRGTTTRDLTDYGTKDGKFYRYHFDYVVEGWLFTLDGTDVPSVQTLDTTVAAYPPSVSLSSPPALPSSDDLIEKVIHAS